MSLYYFIPSPRDRGATALDELGLLDRFPAGQLRQTPYNGDVGGEKRSGTLWHRKDLPKDASRLEWHQSVDGAWWLGIDRDNPPTPEWLARPRMIAGMPVRLRDGNMWLIPRVWPSRLHDESRACGLPLEPMKGQDGAVRYSVQREYAALVQQAQEWLELVQSDAGTTRDMFGFCAALLGVGYRVGPTEVLALRLLDSDSSMELIAVAIDLLEHLRDG